MAITKIKLKQLENSVTAPGSIPATDASNILTYVAPSSGVNHLWGFETGGAGTLPVLIGTNLAYDTITNTLNASAGAGGYSEVQEESSALTARSKLAFIGTGLTAADDAGNSRTTVTLDTFLNTLATAGTVLLSSGNVSGTLPVGSGGTGATTLTGALIGNGTGAVTAVTSSTTDQILKVTGANTYTWGTLNLASTAAVAGVLDEANGGTGNSSYTIGDILYASTASVLSKLPDVVTGNALISGGIGVAPSYGKIGLTTHVSGILPIANGGTGSSSQNFVDLTTDQTIAGIKTFSANVILNGTPTLTTHAVNKGYVDGLVNGISWKDSVDLATTGNITLSGEQSIDGVVTSASRVLVRAQTLSENNGIYTTAAGAWARTADMDAWAEVPAAAVFVEAGSTLADTAWVCTSNDGGTLGTTAITWVKFSSASGTIDGGGAPNTLAWWSDADTLDDASLSYTNGSVFALGTTSNAAFTVLTTKGTDDLGTAFGYLHQNSAGTQVFRVANDGTLTIGASSGTPISINTSTLSRAGAITLTASSSGGAFTFNSAANAANAITFNLSGSGGGLIVESSNASNTSNVITSNTGSRTYTTGNGGNFIASGTYTASTGSATYTGLGITNTINQTGTATGVIRGIHVIPTISNAVNYTGVEVTTRAQDYAIHTTVGKVRFDIASAADYDMFYRGTGGELVRIANTGTTGHVLTGTASGAPSWAAPSGGTKTVGYIVGSGTGTYNLPAGIVVKDVDGAAFAFSVPTDVDLIDVYLNGVMLSRSGTVSRDYTLSSGTGDLVLASAIDSNDQIKLVKRV